MYFPKRIQALPYIDRMKWFLRSDYDLPVHHWLHDPLLAGRTYRPDPFGFRRQQVNIIPPVPVVNGNQVECLFPDCDFSHASGLEMLKHTQRVHKSRNEPLDEGHYGPVNWYAQTHGMPVTDLGGYREALIKKGIVRKL